LLTAGQHGVEGYLGSAIQINVLRTLCDRVRGSSSAGEEKTAAGKSQAAVATVEGDDDAASGQAAQRARELFPRGTWFVLVHVMNPHGMSWYRRWNEENADLNRNFLPDGIPNLPQSYEDRKALGANRMYKSLDGFLNPRKRIGCCDCFLAKVVHYICCLGKPAIKQAVAGGQPEYPRGLFYSGDHEMQSTRIVTAFLTEIGLSRESTSLKFVVHNDLHSGLGPHGHDSVLTVNSAMEARVESLLGDAASGGVRVGGCSCCGNGRGLGTFHTENIGPDGEQQSADGEAKGTAYVASGNIMDGLKARLCPVGNGCEWIPFSEEFGTLGNVKVLKILRAENALNNVQPTASISMPERVASKEAFCPNSPAWRASCLARGTQVSLRVISRLSQA